MTFPWMDPQCVPPNCVEHTAVCGTDLLERGNDTGRCLLPDQVVVAMGSTRMEQYQTDAGQYEIAAALYRAFRSGRLRENQLHSYADPNVGF